MNGEMAEMVQLAIEYDPNRPSTPGASSKGPPGMLASVRRATGVEEKD